MVPQTTHTTSSLTALPPELLIHILSYLDVQSLVFLQLASKAFDALFKDPLNESVIWRNACVIHGLIGLTQPNETSESPSSLDVSATQTRGDNRGSGGPEPPRREWGRWREWMEKQSRLRGSKGETTDAVWSDVLDLYSSQSFIALSTDVNWKAFFKHRLEIHRSFVGQLPSDITCYRDSESSTISPDPNDDDSYLARIRRVYEALIRIQSERKKRQHTVDDSDDTTASTESALTDALLSRFVYPYLLAASSYRAYVWDVRTGEEVQVIEDIQKITIPKGYGKDSGSNPLVREGGGGGGGGGEAGEGSAPGKSIAEAPYLANVFGLPPSSGNVSVMAASVQDDDEEEGVFEGSSSSGKGKGKGKREVFPTFQPFKSGWWDANSTFSGNWFSSSRGTGTSLFSTSSSAPALGVSNISGNKSKGDPLSLISSTFTHLGSINYVELGERWIFFCGEEDLRVFARGKESFEGDQPLRMSTGANSSTSFSDDDNHEAKGSWTPEDFASLTPGQLVLRIPAESIQYSRWSASLGPQSYRPHWGSEIVRQEVIWDEEMATKSEESVNVNVVDSPAWNRIRERNRGKHRLEVRIGDGSHQEEEEGEMEQNGLGMMIKRRRRMHDEFGAVHISPCQNHLALILSSSRLLFIPHFERLIKAEEDLWNIGVDVQLGSVRCPSVYLSYGCGEAQGGGSAGRIGVVTQQGIYIVTPYLKRPTTTTTRPVELIVMRLAPSFMDPRRLIDVSCLQMSDTGVWVNYDTPEPPKMEAQEDEIEAKNEDNLETGKGKNGMGRPTTSGNGGRSGGGMESKSQKPPLSYHTPGKARRWTSQQFPLGTTPPSQFQVWGGKCKWNDAEDSTRKRMWDSTERAATLHDGRLTITLDEKRIDEHGMGSRGVQGLCLVFSLTLIHCREATYSYV
ncbi:hypothetical protein H1R20_g8699, partial [Candolleomyces eurysporus]